jgi:hypothetical protein
MLKTPFLCGVQSVGFDQIPKATVYKKKIFYNFNYLFISSFDLLPPKKEKKYIN